MNIFTKLTSFFKQKKPGNTTTQSNLSSLVISKDLKNFLENGDNVDEILIAEKIKSLGINFEEDIDIHEYIQSLCLRKVSYNSVIDTAKELKKRSPAKELS